MAVTAGNDAENAATQPLHPAAEARADDTAPPESLWARSEPSAGASAPAGSSGAGSESAQTGDTERPLWAQTYHRRAGPHEPAAATAGGDPVERSEAMSTPPPPSWPAGWYDVPDRVNTRGYWDGQRWTGDFVPKDATTGAAGQAPVSTAGATVAKNGLIVGLIGFGLLAVGSLGPWATAAFVSVSGTSGDGKLTLVAAVIGALTLLPGGGAAVLSALIALAGLGVSIYDIAHVSDKASQATFAGVQIIQVGWGLYVSAGGAGIAIIGALMHRSNTNRARHQQPAA